MTAYRQLVCRVWYHRGTRIWVQREQLRGQWEEGQGGNEGGERGFSLGMPCLH